MFNETLTDGLSVLVLHFAGQVWNYIFGVFHISCWKAITLFSVCWIISAKARGAKMNDNFAWKFLHVDWENWIHSWKEIGWDVWSNNHWLAMTKQTHFLETNNALTVIDSQLTPGVWEVMDFTPTESKQKSHR